jgi:hypothetical protein
VLYFAMTPNPQAPAQSPRSKVILAVIIGVLCGSAVTASITGLLWKRDPAPRDELAKEREPRVPQEMRKAIGGLERDLSKKVASGEGLKPGEEPLSKQVKDRLEHGAQGADPTSRAAQLVRVMTRVASRQEQVAAELVNISRAAADAKDFEVTNVKSVEDLERRRGVCLQVVVESAKIIRAYDDYEEMARAEFRKEGVADEEIERVMAEAKPRMTRINSLSKKLRETDIRSATATMNMFLLMQGAWGHWELRNGFILFENDQWYSLFRTLSRERDAAVDEQAVARRELAAALID